MHTTQQDICGASQVGTCLCRCRTIVKMVLEIQEAEGVSSTMFFTSNDKNIYLKMWFLLTFDVENILPFL